MQRGLLAGALGSATLFWGAAGAAQDASSPGTVTTPYPTFHNISVEWALGGDDDADGVVTVRYRQEGDPTFRDGLPLFRVPAGSNAGHSWSNKHAGSIFALEPGRTYEVELTLTDPDGGDASETVLVSTRAIPTDAADAQIVEVTPETIADAVSSANPGDILQLGSGTYAGFSMDRDGEPGRPIVLRSAAAGTAVIEGELTLTGRSYVHIEDLEIHGRIRFNNAESIVVRGCHIVTTEHGIVSYLDGVDNAYIVDNVIEGPTSWDPAALGVDGDNLGEGVQLTGAGNVVAFNAISGFRDCISLLEQSEAKNQVSIDIYGNDLDVCADDGIEADYAMGNVRVYRNRITRSFMGISSQPSLGGPTYFIRNVMYGVIYEAFKLHNGSVGDVILHNTVVKSGDAFAVYTGDSISRLYSRNNLFLGGPGGTYGGYDPGDGAVIMLRSADATCSLDSDGLGTTSEDGINGRIGDTTFSSLAELRQATTELDAVEVSLDTFAATVPFPADPFAVTDSPSLALESSGAAVDRGVVLANVNDGFTGEAPDLGALELGADEPVYGPSGTLGEPSGEAGGDGGTTSSTTTGGSGASSRDGEATGDDDSDSDGGCGCRAAAQRQRGALPLALVLTVIAFLRRGRDKRSIRPYHAGSSAEITS